MISFKDIVGDCTPEKLKNIITIEGHPVWDYKANGYTVYLISEDPWQGCEDEYVTVQELRKYIVQCQIPFDEIIFATEADREILQKYKWSEKQLDFYF